MGSRYRILASTTSAGKNMIYFSKLIYIPVIIHVYLYVRKDAIDISTAPKEFEIYGSKYRNGPFE